MSKKPQPRTKAGGSISSQVWENLALGMASGILVALPFLQSGLFWLHYVALIPWVLLLSDPTRRHTWVYYLIGAYVFILMGYGPFSALHKAVPFMAGLVLVPPAVAFPILFRPAFLKLKPSMTLFVPVVWVTAEWVRIQFNIGSVGLHPLGSSQYMLTPLIQIADVTGLAGVSFLVAAANGWLLDIWLTRKKALKLRFRTLAVFPLLVVGALIYGAVRMASIPTQPGPRLALLQFNMLHYLDPAKAKPLFEKELAFTRNEIPPGSSDLVVWPENAIDYVFSEDAAYRDGLAQLALEQKAPVLAGAYAWASRESGTLYTSGFLFSKQGESVGRYDKNHLIPWAEYMPFDGFWGEQIPILLSANRLLGRSLLGYEARVVPGREIVLFALEFGQSTIHFAAPICYEVSSPAVCRQAVRQGASLLINISSEGFFGAPVYYHMWAHSIFRAVENRVPVARAANNGISGLIDPLGRPHSVLRGNKTGRPFLEEGSLVDTVRLNTEAGSFYSRFGDVFSYLCVAVSVLLLAAAWWRSADSSGHGKQQARPRTQDGL